MRRRLRRELGAPEASDDEHTHARGGAAGRGTAARARAGAAAAGRPVRDPGRVEEPTLLGEVVSSLSSLSGQVAQAGKSIQELQVQVTSLSRFP